MFDFSPYDKVFVTGIDTNIGKTVASAWLLHQGFSWYWKPIQTGAIEGQDTETIRRLAPRSWTHDPTLEPAYIYPEPLSPHMAASLHHQTIDIDQLTQYAQTLPKNTVIEGAGGVMVPITPDYTFLDWIQILGFPVCLVTHPRLGTLNHTLLTLHALHSRNIAVMGIIMNGVASPEIIKTIEHLGQTKLIACLPHFSFL